MRSRVWGFNLIEVMTVLVIISLCISMTVPLYQHYVVKTRRMEAANKLLQVALALENFYAHQQRYTGATLAKLNFNTWAASNNYRLFLQTKSHSFLLTAKAMPLQAARDRLCLDLTLDDLGQKGVTGKGGVENCW
ncbi:MAG: prepilin-type N-terminal cleavage/methylation domain-containing protein [Gammaproteobacteria bacterium]|nr:prepilin-type N-terminal cleavage/methylation domain-containing protein [Gammaproteobacteria bacterium]